MNWRDALPDVDSWQPDDAKEETLRNSLMITCQQAQARILARAEDENRFNLQNFDSGMAIEEIVREELARLLPNRYCVSPGVINDRKGRTAGDCDLIVRDATWTPAIKSGATDQSRRVHFPIEGVYAIAEIKRTLGLRELDEAMRKLVRISRLDRPENPYGHITENQHLTFLDKDRSLLNPLHSAVFATRIPEGSTFDDVVTRFGNINEKLERKDMVKMLCVLDEGTAWYSIDSGNPYNATYMCDRDQTLIMQVNPREPQNAFYRYFVEILGHLNRSVLGLVGLGSVYGEPPPPRDIRIYPEAVFNTNAT
ncbi:MAG: hypothetical protein F4X40_01755 [Chloroflexi bacterium]|nr:hypothetical protein [Chloroflexota bacterium]